MVKKRKARKNKILYHRLIILGLVFLLAIYLLVVGGKKIYDIVMPFLDNTSEVAVNKETTKVQNIDNKKIVVIDAGHGGYDAGSNAQDGTLEKEVNLKIALLVGSYLEASNTDVMVLYTREDDDYYWTTDNKQDLFYRVNLATENDAALFLSIHLNSNDESTEIRGHETWVSLTSNENEIFAHNINEALNTLNYNEDRGVKDESESPLLVLHYNTVPSALVELGYINNNEDFKYINSKAGSKSIAKGLADAINKTLSEITE